MNSYKPVRSQMREDPPSPLRLRRAGRLLNSEVGPVVVPEGQDYAAARDAEGGEICYWLLVSTAVVAMVYTFS